MASARQLFDGTVLLAAVGCLAYGLASGAILDLFEPTTRCHVHHQRALQLEGVLVDGGTGDPVLGARVIPLPLMRPLGELDDFDRRGGQLDRRPHATAESGTFETTVRVSWCVCYVDDEPQGPTHPPERHGVRALLIQIEGRPEQIIPIAAEMGTWTPGSSESEPWATWNLGTITLPPDP